LATSPNLHDLTHLYLGDNNIGDAGAQALAASSHMRHLTHLELSYNHIDDAGAQALAASPNLHLMHLDLSNNGITDAGAEALAASQNLRDHLTYLNLDGSNIGAAVRREMNRWKREGQSRA
jgi:Leucine-rich repeat (LRR) protein